MKLIAFLGTVICLHVTVAPIQGQVPSGIRVPDGVGPILVGFQAKVYRGEENILQLSRGNKSGRANLEYSIFEPPTYGALNVDPNTGAANYTINNPLKPGVVEDRFEFRVSDGKGRFSAAVEVRLEFVERVAVLEVQKNLDFGEVVMSGVMDKELTVTNNGDGEFSGHIVLPPSFVIEGKSKVVLAILAKEKKTMVVRFLGRDDPGEGSAFLRLEGDGLSRRVNLTYDVKPPFHVQDKITLEFDDENYSRRARLRIKNPFNESLGINLRLPRGLNANDVNFEILAESTQAIELVIPPHDADRFDGILTIEANRFSKKVKVVAAESPPRIVVVGNPDAGEVLSFKGVINEKAEIRPGEWIRSIQLRNIGGQAANVSMMTNPPFYISAINNPYFLPPGQSVVIPVELRAQKVGKVEDTLLIDYAGDPLQVRLLGNVILPDGMTNVVPTPPPGWRGKKVSNDPGLGGVSYRDLFYGKNKRKSNPAIPTVKKIRIIEQRSNSLVIGWPSPAGSNWEYELDALVKLRDEKTGLPVPTWVQIGPEHLTLTKNGSDIQAEIVGISPGWSFQFSIFTVNPQGESSLPATLGLAVQEKVGFLERVRVWMVAAVGLFLIFIVIGYRKYRAESQQNW